MKTLEHKLATITAEEEAEIQRGIDADPDSPEWTAEDFAKARPFAEVFPDLAEAIRKGPGRPPVAQPKQQVSVRLDPDVIAHFKAGGRGWQGRLNAVLRKAAGL